MAFVGCVVLFSAWFGCAAFAEDPRPTARDFANPGTPLGATREVMWAAPTAADWAKPCLLTWQRTWEDARAVAQETGRMILICINMDGEIASEHYAGVRYRQTEVAALYEPYVTVIASVYRHTPRDHDDQGNRIPCPRFGGVTCGEHIRMEATVYEKYLDGTRVAPRHIAVDPNGEELYDVYYANDTASVFQRIHDTAARHPTPQAPIVRGDRPIVERVGSRDVRDRAAVEEAYRTGDAALRKAILDAARQHQDVGQLELLRQALFGLDADMVKAARQQLAQATSADATALISEALQSPTDAAERNALIGALKRLGKDSKVAQWLAVVHQGLSGDAPRVIDVQPLGQGPGPRDARVQRPQSRSGRHRGAPRPKRGAAHRSDSDRTHACDRGAHDLCPQPAQGPHDRAPSVRVCARRGAKGPHPGCERMAHRRAGSPGGLLRGRQEDGL